MKALSFFTRGRLLAIFSAFFALLLGIRLAMMTKPQQLHVMGSFWASGDAASRGLDPYAIYPLTWIVNIPGPNIADVNLNPPILLPLFQLFALVEPFTMTRLVMLLSAVAYIAIVGNLAKDRVQLLWALLLPAFTDTVMLGQIYVLMLALAVGAWMTIDRKLLPALFLGTLIATKPNFAVTLPILFVAGHQRLSIISGVVAGALSLVPVLIYGPEIYALWMQAVAKDAHWVIPADVSLVGTFSRLSMRPLGIFAAVCVLILALYGAWSNRLEPKKALALGLTASILCAPLAWYHYVMVLIPALVDRPWTRREAIPAALLFVPLSVVMAGFDVPALSLIYPLGLLAFLWCTAMPAKEQLREQLA